MLNISEVRVKLVSERADKLRAFCSITLDGAIVIRDLKIIEGTRGPFVAMPSRKLTDRCPRCAAKNHMRAKFCNDCGHRLPPQRAPRDESGRSRVHADIAHPIHAEARAALEKRVLEEFRAELERSKQPGYKPVEIFDGEDY